MSTSNKRWRERNKQKVTAHWTVSNAIRYGKLKREPCEKCGNVKSHAHHVDYSKPLLIQWLCQKCHWIAHGWIKKEESPESAIDKRYGLRANTDKERLTKKAIELRNAGLSYNAIAKELKSSAGNVFKWINNTKYR